MTAESYATAAGLIERSAAAYVSGVPERPADDGFFGPASVTWKMSADLGGPVAVRSLMMQALHPLAMAGVDQHSTWRQDPVGRLAAISAYLATISFGERAAAEQVAARVRRIHTHVRGVDAATGRSYAASDPALLLWVHAALVDSTLAARGLFGTPRPPPDADRYVAEMVVAAELVGVPAGMAPSVAAGLTTTSRRSGPGCSAPLRLASRWRTCSPRRAWTRTSRDLARRPGRRGGLAAAVGYRHVRVRGAAADPGAGRRSAKRSACSTRCSSASLACSRRGSGSRRGSAPRRGRASRPAWRAPALAAGRAPAGSARRT